MDEVEEEVKEVVEKEGVVEEEEEKEDVLYVKTLLVFI